MNILPIYSVVWYVISRCCDMVSGSVMLCCTLSDYTNYLSGMQTVVLSMLMSGY